MRWGTPCCCYQQQSIWRKNNSSFVELGISRPLGRRGCQSIIKTRTLPADLKSRFFTFTGAGVIARFYVGFTPITLPTPDPVYSLRQGQPAFRDFDIYTIPVAPASLGTKWAADIFAEGNASNQSKGSVGASYGSGWIIEPNQEILLEIESLEAAQNISARLEMYNGLLDLPL